jgi:hypothetical protein
MADNVYVVLSVQDTRLNLSLIPIWICFCQDGSGDQVPHFCPADVTTAERYRSGCGKDLLLSLTCTLLSLSCLAYLMKMSKAQNECRLQLSGF